MLLDKTELVLFNERWPISNGVFKLDTIQSDKPYFEIFEKKGPV